MDAIREIFLNPGELYFGKGGMRISTLLGSCVSITLWHPLRRIGGMCHYMLTERVRPADAALDGRFGSEAFALFLQHMAAAGTRPGEYQAKLFGGGNMLRGASTGEIGIGPRNVAYGRHFLASQGIPLMAEHVVGSGRRKLYFDLWSGDVWLAFPQGSDARIRSAGG